MALSRKSFEMIFNDKSIDDIRAGLKERSESRKRQLLSEIVPEFKP